MQSSPKICALATKGLSSGDGSRLRALVGDLDVVFVDVSRGSFGQRLLLTPWSVIRKVRRVLPDLVLMEGTGIAGGMALIVMRLVFGIPYVFSTGDANRSISCQQMESSCSPGLDLRARSMPSCRRSYWLDALPDRTSYVLGSASCNDGSWMDPSAAT